MRSSFAYPGGYHTSAWWPADTGEHYRRLAVTLKHRRQRLHDQVQRCVCYLCGKPFSRKVPGLTVTKDHVHPKSRGGQGWLLAHWLCNKKKANRLPRPCEVLYLQAAEAMLAAPARRCGKTPP